MRFPRIPTRPFLLGALTLTPLVTFAQESLFGPIIPQTGACTCPGSAPSWGCIVQVLQSVINVGIAVAIVVIVLLITYAGFRLMTAGASPEARKQARNILLNAVVGLGIVLIAWLAVDFFMKAVYNPGATFGGEQPLGPWHSILVPTGDSMCLAINETPTPLTSGLVDIVTGEPVTSGTGGSGSCTIPTGGPCTVATLSQSFGSVASQAAQICTAESGGNPQRLSRTDRTVDGDSYSVGLFQINLTNSFNHRVNGRSCSNAFSGPCQGSAVVQSGSSAGTCSRRVTDRTLYNQCVAAAQNPGINMAAARSLYDGDWGRWSTARVCNLPR